MARMDTIVITQTCDLENGKVQVVALCPIYAITKFEEFNPSWKRSDWNEVARGRREGLHLLPPVNEGDLPNTLVVDFRQIFSMPFDVLMTLVEGKPRVSLCSPYLEHFSQSLGHYFMRVALPEIFPRFR